MSNNKPGQRKSNGGDRVQNEDIEDEMSASTEDEDLDELNAGAEAGSEDEEDQNGRAQRSASQGQGGQGHKREGFEARGGRNARGR